MKRLIGLPPVLHTKRLVLRPLALEDAPEVQKQFQRFEVVRYLNKSVPWPYPADGARSFLQGYLQRAAEGREHAWAITLDGQQIGSISLSPEGEENRGFWLTPEFWGQGYMQEASDRIIQHALVELQWPDLVTGNAVDNAASGRIKKRQGFELVETFRKEFVGGEMEYQRWRVTREAWLQRAQP